MNFNFFNKESNQSLSPKQLEKISRWEKERSYGKWFWIFRRSAAWFLCVILIFAAALGLGINEISFKNEQVFIVFFMLGGFVVSSFLDWTKMEKLYQTYVLTRD